MDPRGGQTLVADWAARWVAASDDPAEHRWQRRRLTPRQLLPLFWALA